ncbi:MAG: HIRAN domain-containing protein [Ruminococcus sp.]|uniref:HIRAN domain-containing protein n=1 Tax=Ruminococcus sp. TaxID=41978 RepID=UPI0025CDEBBC|nr:HIRAN domain-containing protein [Ruminococcus sp.]MBO4867964.1 HIRAN domain-containing protein [Ruminococcus sp.]
MMKNIKTVRSRVTTMANRLVKMGYGRRMAMLKAWIIVKAERLAVRVAGVTFGKRQQILAALEGRQSVIKLRRESDNAYDNNAVSVWVFAEGTRGYYRVGYVPKKVAAVISSLLDKGEILLTDSFSVTGSGREGYSLGARFAIAV